MALYALINKEVIPYICEKKKVNIEYLHISTKLKIERLNKWLDVSDEALPTILQAKKIARCLHIPFAGLYMNTEDIHIKEIPSIRNYRTLDGSLGIDDSGLNIAICDVVRERDFLIEECGELNVYLPSLSMPTCASDNPIDWAHAIRNHYEIDILDQFKCKSTRQLYLYLRERIEHKGVFVQCFTDVPVEVVRGFAVYEQELPIIGINDNDRPPAKSFSMIHELVHLIKRESSVCNAMYNETSSLNEEVFCNAVAGELLVPQEELLVTLKKRGYNKPYAIDDIQWIADRFSISKEVVIWRLLDCGKINNTEYKMYAEEFRRIIEREREEQKLARKAGLQTRFGKSISRDAVDRTSSVVCKTLYKGYEEEAYSKRDIARHLGIAQKHVDKFLVEVSKWSK